MTEKDTDHTPLEAYFRAARESAPQPDEALIARILADADTVRASAAAPRPARARPGHLAQLFRVIGGWPAAAGLATVAVAGVWLGISPPALLADTAGAYLSSDAAALIIDISPEAAFGIAEGAL